MITLLVVFFGNMVKEGTAVEEIKIVGEKLGLQGFQFGDNYYN